MLTVHVIAVAYDSWHMCPKSIGLVGLKVNSGSLELLRVLGVCCVMLAEHFHRGHPLQLGKRSTQCHLLLS